MLGLAGQGQPTQPIQTRPDRDPDDVRWLLGPQHARIPCVGSAHAPREGALQPDLRGGRQHGHNDRIEAAPHRRRKTPPPHRDQGSRIGGRGAHARSNRSPAAHAGGLRGRRVGPNLHRRRRGNARGHRPPNRRRPDGDPTEEHRGSWQQRQNRPLAVRRSPRGWHGTMGSIKTRATDRA